MKRFAAYALGTTFCLSALAAETNLKIEDLPTAVQTAMKEQLKGATVVRANKEVEHGHTMYEVETKLDGKGRDLTFTGDGSLAEVEQEVDLDSIPGPAKQAIQKRAAGGTIQKVETITQGSITSYEAQVKTKAGKNQEVAVNADGSTHKED